MFFLSPELMAQGLCFSLSSVLMIIRTMYLLNKNLLTDLVILRCMLWGVGLLDKTTLSIPLLMSMSEAFSVFFILNKTLLHTHTHTHKGQAEN